MRYETRGVAPACRLTRCGPVVALTAALQPWAFAAAADPRAVAAVVAFGVGWTLLGVAPLAADR